MIPLIFNIQQQTEHMSVMWRFPLSQQQQQQKGSSSKLK